MTDALARAQSALKVPVKYKLGQPGRIFPPGADDVPVPPVADCSGFALWCIGMERFVVIMTLKFWFDTSRIWHDATGGKAYFEPCAPTPGCLIVYPDKGKREGHVGIVSEVVDGKVAKVIHCSKGNEKTGSAVQETGSEVFTRNGAICVRRKA